MADTAAHLVDRVLPHVPVRQWVLTLPFGLRYRMAYDAGLTDEADPSEVDPLNRDQPLLALLSGAAVRGRTATGHRAGRRPVRLGDRVDADDLGAGRVPALCCVVDGVSLHAGVAVPARDRARL